MWWRLSLGGLLVCLWSSLVLPASISGKKHRPIEAHNPNAFESDMLLSSEQLDHLFKNESDSSSHRFKRKAVVHDDQRWPKGVLVYQFDPVFPLPDQVKSYFRQAVQWWSSVTCLQFREFTGPSTFADLGHTTKLLVSYKEACQTNVGYPGSGTSSMSLSSSCLQPDQNPVGHVAHELGHALGFYHEHSRPDRDDYVTVVWSNINSAVPNAVDNFRKYTKDEIRMAEPYDYGSLMHYGPDYLSKDSQHYLLTLEPRKAGKKSIMGQRDELSFLDVKTMNELYQCKASCPNIACQNGGFLSTHCRCNCPNGFTGLVCELPNPSTGASCGGKLTAAAGTITSPGYPNDYPDNLDCHWMIEGPPGSSISLNFADFSVEDDPICYFDWVEIREDGPIMSGSRYCGETSNHLIQYESNVLYLRMHSDDSGGSRGYRATYTINPGAGWLPWGEWSSCTKVCGGGSRSRRRSCPGNRCQGPQFEASLCNEQTC